MIAHSSVCEARDQCLNSTKIPEDLKQEVQNISCAVQPIIEEEDKDEIVPSMLSPFLSKYHLENGRGAVE